MPNSERSSQGRLVISRIVIAVIALVVAGVLLYKLYDLVPTSIPLTFILSGLFLFSLPGLLHPDPKQPGGPLSSFAYRCYQLVQDEDPRTPGKVSLAKFQMLFWTIILAGSFVWLLLNKGVAPQIPNEWLVLMGISNGTYVLSKWTKSVKEESGKPEKEDKAKNPS